jgi:hypothetical protein
MATERTASDNFRSCGLVAVDPGREETFQPATLGSEACSDGTLLRTERFVSASTIVDAALHRAVAGKRPQECRTR